MTDIRCDYEPGRFPAADFETTTKYGRVHARNLSPGTPLHTSSGNPIEDDDWRGSADLSERWQGAAEGRA